MSTTAAATAPGTSEPASAEEPIVVAHYTGRFLPLTEGWIYDQIRFAQGVRPIALTRRALNLRHFDAVRVVSLSDLSLRRRLFEESLRVVSGWHRTFRDVCRGAGVSLIHAHFGDRGLEALPLARQLRIPLVTSFYGRDMSRHRGDPSRLREEYESLFAGGALCLAEGPAARDALIELGSPAEKVAIHRLGVDIEAIPFSARALGSDGTLRVLMAARFTEKKGLEYGLTAVGELIRQGRKVRLTIAGDAGKARDEMAIRDRLKSFVSTHNLGNVVTFAGFLSREELHAIARDHHLLMHPSVTASDGDAEGGHPVILTEMAAAGMPMLATRHCDIPEIVQDRVTGWLTEERDTAGLVAALAEAIEVPEKLTAYGKAARALVVERYDARRVTLGPIYRELLRRW